MFRKRVLTEVRRRLGIQKALAVLANIYVSQPNQVLAADLDLNASRLFFSRISNPSLTSQDSKPYY